MATSSEESDDSDGGFILPGVKETLRNILAEYPNNGQILKEIIQNAEDAGATEIKFFLDTLPRETSGKLLKDGLKQFQGPALYVFNNAVFTKKDWEGIRSLGTSVKKDDPIKVGRFGLGFKSVFHITDLPSVLSQYQLMMIDPHQRFFKQGTHSLYLNKKSGTSKKRSDRYSGHLEAFKRVLDHPELNGAFDGEALEGTLFRFPIRLAPGPDEMLSELTDQCYKMDEIRHLLESLKQDADLILLFMKTLNTIHVTILHDNTNGEAFLKVSLKAGEADLDITKERADFLESIKDRQLGNHSDTKYEPLTMSAVISIQMEVLNEPEKHKMWLVSHYYAGSEVSVDLRNLIKDGKVGLIPLVGCAIEITKEDVVKCKQPAGHIFCVLPLPMTETSPSGLPIHVNGYFALDQNRAHLKWPTVDQKEGSDPKLTWNMCLLTELLPQCYIQLILKARNLELQPALIYHMIADCDKVHDKWKIVIAKLFPQLYQNDIIYSAVQNKWVKTSDCVVDDLHSQPNRVRDVLYDLLRKTGCNLAQIPAHVQNGIVTYTGLSLTPISPRYVREQMQAQPNTYKGLQKEDKHSLLSYLLQDEQFSALEGLELITLCDGTGAAFVKCTHSFPHPTPVYLPSIEKYPMAMFPNHQGFFMNTDDMDPCLVQKLHSVAQTCSTQLAEMTDSEARRLIFETEPESWKDETTIDLTPNQAKQNIAWSDSVSNYIVNNRKGLDQFEHLHLIQQNSVKLIQLKKNSGILLEGKPQINSHLKRLLNGIGVTVINYLPKPWDSQEQKLKSQSYIHSATPVGILQAIADKVNHQYEIPEYLHRASKKEREALQIELANISLYSNIDRKLIRSLPIFKSTDQQWVSFDGNDPIMCKEVIPIKVKVRMIKNNERVMKLASLAGVNPLQEADLIVDHIVPYLSEYTRLETQELMLHILENCYRMMHQGKGWERLKIVLKTSKCLADKDHSLCSISELYHPKLSSLVEHKVPHEVYQEKSSITILEELGLKPVLSKDDILNIARNIECNNDISKSEELLKYLERHCSILRDKSLVDQLADIVWVLRDETQNNELPNSLKVSYEESRKLWKPSEVCDQKFVYLIGSAQPLIMTKHVKEVSNAFGWGKIPHDGIIHQHMKNISTSYKHEDKGVYSTLAKSVYKQMVSSPTLQTLLIQDSSLKWIWHGNGFTGPSSIALTKADFPLEPYIYFFPSEMKEFRNIIRKAPVQEGSVESILMSTLEKMNAAPIAERDYDRDLRIAVATINKIASEVKRKKVELSQVKDRLLLPVQSDEDRGILKLKKINECAYMYSVQAWLTQKCSAHLMSHCYVHRDISEDTCTVLGVPSLMSKILGDDNGFGDYGQTEDLTTRLQNILKDYKDGFSVPKELIQNADDAGATKVSFIYDERDNQDARTFLLDPEMCDLQGPALWVHNDATFSKDDYENIEKLGGATKAEKGNKIGKFGLGFNAVYNLTDVPSFVSGESIAFFDPHQTFLGKAISGKPGIKLAIHFVKKLPQLADQFKPYNGMCKCNLSCNDNEVPYYKGTLFRFPLRRKPSKISKICYDEVEMKKLLQTLEVGAHKMMLFTQNVREITISKIPKGTSNKNEVQPVQSEILLTITKEKIQCIRSPISKNSMLDSSYLYLQQSCESTSKPESSDIVKTIKTIEDTGNMFLEVSPENREKHWLVSWNIGESGAYKTAKSDPRRHNSLAGVAMNIEPTDKEGCYRPISTGSATIFCFMPLPVPPIASLPVHINGSFAVTQSRRELCEWKPGDKSNEEAKWNEILMRDSVVCAYLDSLVDLKAIMDPDMRKNHYNVWPTMQNSSNVYGQFQESFYKRLLSVNNGPEIFTDGRSWRNVQNTVLMDTEWTDEQSSNDEQSESKIPLTEAKHVLKIHHPESIVVADMPEVVLKTLKETSCFQMTMYTVDKFFKDVFFHQIDTLPEEYRDSLMLYALKNEALLSKGIIYLMNTVPCVPVKPKGQLRTIPDLIDSSSELKDLYCDVDEVFPADAYIQQDILRVLRQLGMKHKCTQLTWYDILERATSVEMFNEEDGTSAKERSKQCVIAMTKKLESPRLSIIKNTDKDIPNDVQDKLLKTAFLPIKQCPLDFPNELWKQSDSQFGTADDLHLAKHMHYISKASFILDETNMSPFPYSVSVLLGLDRKNIPLDWALDQMTAIISYPCIDKMLLVRMCSSVYDFLEQKLKHVQAEEEAYHQTKTKINNALCFSQCLLIDQTLIYPQQIAEDLNPSCPPYLYGLNGHSMKWKYQKLLKAFEVKARFGSDDFKKALGDMHQDIQDNVMSPKQLEVALNLVSQLYNARKYEDVLIDDLAEIYAPTEDRRLVLASDLCFDDIPSQWVKTTETMNFAHDSLPRGLGIKTKQEKNFRLISEAIPFGQKEKLTQRLKNIIKSYPCDQSIMKELLQNADDACATELHFVLDKRQHAGKKLFLESWSHLQGPALLVYNNKPFTEKDLAGIQNLGEGSKGSDPNKTGQYGIGFNAVYHLTDTPTFLTNGSEIGTKLCAFDPNLKYVCDEDTPAPGVQIQVNNHRREVYPDVFSCYEHEFFSEEESTLFRLPLRTQEIADQSAISNEAVKPENVQKLLEEFKSEMFDALLFVNSVEKIVVGQIDAHAQENKMHAQYHVTAEISEEDKVKLRAFNEKVTSHTIGLKSGKITVDEIPLIEVTYEKCITDSKGKKETWLISRRFGFEEGIEIAPCIKEAYTRGDLLLLPHGAVAGRTETKGQTHSKAFCFLPLPVEINVPVHINGHFALDDARRDLFDDKSYRTEWNHLVLKEIVVPAYITYINKIKVMLNLGAGEPLAYGSTLLKLEQYYNLFPKAANENFSQSYWDFMSVELYRTIASNQDVMLLPVVTKTTSTDSCTIKWWPVNSISTDEEDVYFDNICNSDSEAMENFVHISNRAGTYNIKAKRDTESRNPCISDVLKTLGMRLLDMPQSIFDNFNQSGVTLKTVTPASVIAFLKTWHSPKPLCKLKLSIPVESSLFCGVKCVADLLEYCLNDKHSGKVDIENLPLCVQQDNVLTKFSSEDPKILSDFVDLVPKMSNKFIHKMLLPILDQHKDQPALCELSIRRLSELLPQSEFKSKLFDKEIDVESSKFGYKFEHWISRLWTFVGSTTEIKAIQEKSDVSEKIMEIEGCLQPLSKWSIIPCIRSQTHNMIQTDTSVLAPICRRYTILDVNCTRPDSKTKDSGLLDVLKKIPVLKLDSGALPGYAQLLVTTVCNPSNMLDMLLHIKKHAPEKFTLRSTDADIVLGYYVENLQLTKDTPHAITKLRQLPLFVTMQYSCISVTDTNEHDEPQDVDVYVIPSSVPTAGMDCWLQGKTHRRCFLKEKKRFEELYDWLGFTTQTVSELYCGFMFPQFSLLNSEERKHHLRYLKNDVIPDLDHIVDTEYKKYTNAEKIKAAKERDVLLSGLRTLEFIEDPLDDTILHCVSKFVDQLNPVWREMRPTQHLPDAWFQSYTTECDKYRLFKKEDNWTPFFRRFGLKSYISPVEFAEFAKEVESEAKLLNMDESSHYDSKRSAADGIEKKSRVLVKHLFQRKDILAVGISAMVKAIKFISPHLVKGTLAGISPQYGITRKDGRPVSGSYVCFQDSLSSDFDKLTWTVSSVLPRYADVSAVQYANLHSDLFHDFIGFNKIEKRLISIKDQLHYTLSSPKQPTGSLVGQNWINICKAVKLDKLHQYQKLELIEICTKTFEYLQRCEHEIDKKVWDQLQNTNVIFVDAGQRLVMPRQLLIDPYRGDEIYGYIYKIPSNLEASKSILQKLGCTEKVTLCQLSKVLEEIYIASRNTSSQTEFVKDPNALYAFQKALTHFFHLVLVEKEHDFSGIDKLYLLSNNNQLKDAATLVCNDRPDYKRRVKKLEVESQSFMKDLSSLDILLPNEAESLKQLPVHLRPRMLSSIVVEVLADSELVPVTYNVAIVEQLNSRLKDKHFYHGILRLVHNTRSKGKDADVDKHILLQLQSIEIIGTEKITTVLKLSDSNEILLNTEKQKPYHIDQTDGTKVYINFQRRGHTEVANRIVKMIIGMHVNLQDYEMRLYFMLRHDNPGDILSVLDDDGINEYNISYEDMNLPVPGDYIPVADHHLLEKRPGSLFAGDFVAYSEDSIVVQIECGVAPVYKYAKIIRHVRKDEHRTYKVFEIDVGGGEKVEKPDFELYAFKSIKDIEEEDASTDDHLPTLDEIKKEVSDMLERTWDLEENVRIHLVTRAMEMWQASENPHREETFCNNIIQHIFDENIRLSKISRTPKQHYDEHFPDEKGESQQPSYTESLRKVKDYLYDRSQIHIAQRKMYLEHVNSDPCISSGSSLSSRSKSRFSFQQSPSFGAKNPQPGEAVRWMKQAKFDLETAQCHGLKKSKEWIYYICLQSAEKALKAALYYIDALEASLSHDIPVIARHLGDGMLTSAAKQLQALTGEHTTMRYPSKVPYPHTPRDMFLNKDSYSVISLTQQIVDQSQAYMDRLH
ncbi:unnamed protein product [Owenia fusiformis]|uniref:HEPN domain-containing protein n=1 Tax=Owenia fusiformis TaxID=6347 RepID=A0A8S4P4J6_OWEFU|nr:unnamed protein product [Owenia fusiformis]